MQRFLSGSMFLLAVAAFAIAPPGRVAAAATSPPLSVGSHMKPGAPTVMQYRSYANFKLGIGFVEPAVCGSPLIFHARIIETAQLPALQRFRTWVVRSDKTTGVKYEYPPQHVAGYQPIWSNLANGATVFTFTDEDSALGNAGWGQLIVEDANGHFYSSPPAFVKCQVPQ